LRHGNKVKETVTAATASSSGKKLQWSSHGLTSSSLLVQQAATVGKAHDWRSTCPKQQSISGNSEDVRNNTRVTVTATNDENL